MDDQPARLDWLSKCCVFHALFCVDLFLLQSLMTKAGPCS